MARNYDYETGKKHGELQTGSYDGSVRFFAVWVCFFIDITTLWNYPRVQDA
jgi:hypothetical protein